MIYQKKDGMRIVRIKDNLYRYSRERWVCFSPKVLEHFNKPPEVRSVLGRWSKCPNINIASIIRSRLLEVVNDDFKRRV
jgi:hypothetical protein